MEKNNKVCIICKKAYSYCPNCKHDNDKPTWYAIFHDQNCHDIYDVCTSYRDKVFTKKEAYYAIKKLDISFLDDFNESTKNQILDILSYENEKNIEKPLAKEKAENKKNK